MDAWSIIQGLPVKTIVAIQAWLLAHGDTPASYMADLLAKECDDPDWEMCCQCQILPAEEVCFNCGYGRFCKTCHDKHVKVCSS